MPYKTKDIENKGQKKGIEDKVFQTDLFEEKKPKKYILAMFPYPSGSGLHIGHIRNYTIADVLARFYRLIGYNVFHPMGGDSFGLPAEQYAIQTGNHPAVFTNQNIQNFKEQLLRLGFSYDGEKEINTSDPKYYRGTQGIFCQIHKQNLTKLCELPVFGCEKLGTALANEEIKIKNEQKVSERGEYPVSVKNIGQGVLKITDYAEELLEKLESLDGPNNIKTLQKNGIGLSQGVNIYFPLLNSSQNIPVYTTRPDTIYGVVALALSLEHPFIEITVTPKQKNKVSDFIKKFSFSCLDTKKKTIEAEFTGSGVFNPMNKKKIPIFISNFVEKEYGTGAVIIAPFFQKEELYFKYDNTPYYTKKEKIQNQNIDFFFAKKYKLLNKSVLFVDERNIRYVEKQQTNINDKNSAIENIKKQIKEKTTIEEKTTYHLKDGIFSRQRYGGEPIPVIHGENETKELEKEENLPLILPNLVDFKPNPKYYSPLCKAKEGVNIKKDNISGKRDTNVMPQGAGSCGYYLAFLLKNKNNYLGLNSQEAKKIFQKGLPVDIYIGGAEHANLHLLYSRFGHHILIKTNVIPKKHVEPFQKLICQGIVLGTDGEKMSKSRGNTIDPNFLIEKYGIDALRLYVCFVAPIEKVIKFESEKVKAMKKWLDRVFCLFYDEKKIVEEKEKNSELDIYFQITIKQIIGYYKKQKFNLVISSLMSFINKCYLSGKIPKRYLSIFCQLLSPLAPHLSEELWSLGNKNYVSCSIFETNDEQKIDLETEIEAKEKKNIVVQINGKKKLLIPLNEKNKILFFKIKENKKIIDDLPLHFKELLKEKKVVKVITVKNKLINFVTS